MISLNRVSRISKFSAIGLLAVSGFLWIGVLSPRPASADETAPTVPTISIGFDTFGLPSSLTILEGEKREEDLEVKETARFLMIAAAKALFDQKLKESEERIEEGLKKGYYILPQKRILARVHFLSGRLDSAIATAREIAEDTAALIEDKAHLDFMEAVRRYLKISFETQPLGYRTAAVIQGDQKSRHRFITPVGLEADRFGRILQTSFGTDEVIVFTKGLEFDMKLSGIPNPFDVTVDADGNIYVSSFGSDQIYKFKRDGSKVASFGKKGRGPGEFFGPAGLVVSPDRYLYVVDGGNHRIQKFSLDGKHLMSFGTRGTKPGEFISPRAVLVQPVPRSDTYTLLVLSQEGHLLQRFDRYGNFLGVVPTAGLWGARDFDWTPDRGLVFCTSRGELVVLDQAADTLLHLTDEKGDPIVIESMSGLSIDEEAGLIYVADQTVSELRVLRPGTLAERTLINITDLDFEHYPYVGVTFQVTTGSGDPITGLSRKNFSIEEDNHRATPVSVRPLTQTGPLGLIVHLDPSSAMDRRGILVRTFLSNLSRELPSEFFLSIRKGRKMLLESTDNPYLIRKSLARIDEPVSGDLVRDLYETVEAFKGGRGRRNILIVTARESDLSADQFEPLFLDMVNHGISLFVLHLSDRQLPVLKTLCRRTGGSYRFLAETSVSDMAFELATSKTGSYFLVYPSPYGALQTNTSVDLVLRMIYLTDAVSDRIRYFAP